MDSICGAVRPIIKNNIKTAKKAEVYNAYALESAFKLLN